MLLHKSLYRSAFILLWVVTLTLSFSVKAVNTPSIAGNTISDWAQPGVLAAYDKGLLRDDIPLGKDYTIPITRLQLAMLTVDVMAWEKERSLLELAREYELDLKTLTESGQLPELESGSFGDTKSPYAELALRLQLMVGDAGLFKPGDLLTRAEAAIVLQRCMSALGVAEANAAPQIFADAMEIPGWARQAVRFVSGRTDSRGTALMSGDKGAFSPLGTLTIEQAILALLRIDDSKAIGTVQPGWREAPGYNFAQLSLTFGGDCTLGRGLDFDYDRSFDEMYDAMGPDYFFSGIEEFFNDDLTMVNFEGTLTESWTPKDKTFVFKGRPEYAQVLRAGSVDVVTVANNHSMDYYDQGFSDTLAYLSPVVQISGYDFLPIITVKGVNIGFASNTGWSFDEEQQRFIDNAIGSLRAAGADLVVFNFHWGDEGAYYSNDTQQAIAHYCIDQGADLVIGHHPHVAQETETYNGKQIVYSLGNLVFGGNKNPWDKNCLIFRQNYVFDLDAHAVTAETHAAIPYLISSDPERNNYHPVRAE